MTYSVAYLCHRTESRIDLDSIWRNQRISAATAEALDAISEQVHRVITTPPGRGNVTEWCKRQACWERVRSIAISLPSGLMDELVNVDRPSKSGASRAPTPVSTYGIGNGEDLTSVASDTWFRLSHWARETGQLQSWQRSLVFNVGRVLANGRQPSPKQTHQALLALREGERLGFPASSAGAHAGFGG